MLNKTGLGICIFAFLLTIAELGLNFWIACEKLDREVGKTVNKECGLYSLYENSSESELLLNSNCLLKVGNKYFTGERYVEQDIETAIAFWKISSDLGNPEAQFNMGLAHFIYPSLDGLECSSLHNGKNETIGCFTYSLNSKEDIEKGIKYYKNMLKKIELFNYDHDQGIKAYTRFTKSIAYSNLYLYFSSLSGHKGSQLALGFRYENGLGLPNSCEAAFSNYLEVAKDCVLEHRKEGIVQYEELIRISIPDWDPIKKLYSESENQNRHDLALNLAESGNIFIQLAVAKRYLMGSDGFPQNFKKAYKYLRKLAEKAKNLAGTVLDTTSTLIYGEAIGLLGYMYALGLGGGNNKRDLETASEYFSVSAFIYNDPGGHNGMGYVYFHGCKGFEQNFRLSFHHFNESAHHLFPDAQYNLASLYLTGMGTSQSYSEALLWYTRAYEQGHVPASYALAQLNFNGLGTNKDCNVAIQFLKNIIHKSPYVADIVKEINNISNSKNKKLYNVNGLKLFLTLKLALTGHEPSIANIPSLVEKEYRKRNFWGASKFGINWRTSRAQAFSLSDAKKYDMGKFDNNRNKYIFQHLIGFNLNKLFNISAITHYLQTNLYHLTSCIFPHSVLRYLGIDLLEDNSNKETASRCDLGYSQGEDCPRENGSDPWYLPQIFIEFGISKDNLDSMIRYGDNSYYGKGSELRFAINENSNFIYSLKSTERNIVPEIHLNDVPNYYVALDVYKIVAYFTLRSRHMISSVSEACFNLGYMHQFGIGVKQNIKLAVSYYRKMMEVGHIGRMSNGIVEIIIFIAKIHELFIFRTQFLSSLKRKNELKRLVILVIALLVLIAAKLLLRLAHLIGIHLINHSNSKNNAGSNGSNTENASD
ncbi:sel-1 protein [Cryptosporidium ryanae]|uniref:sel-1 protein n=1 Tax=Cryptosporidium ryanae TaxID=515981 RepID=UPI00351A4706|nr:sel-1 protein [Cryptosporidium ryanae]